MYDDADDMPCGESGCYCRCSGGAGHACGCDCPHSEDCDCPDCVPDDAYDGSAEDDEPAEGTCDRCAGSTAEDLERAANGPGINPVCACAIGQGANPDDCVCGPRETPKDNT
ncbi:hypothetical protein ACWCQW_10340 [Streptomyces mirabilis]